MELPVYNQKKEIVDKVVLKDQYFDILFNNDTVFQVYTSLLSNRRQPLAHTKDRSEVSGGGRKPWSQKGTGRARAGSTRSPIWRHGGVTFGPRQNEENFQKKINRKAKTKALEMILSQKIKDNEFFIIDDINLANTKTKEMEKIVKLFARPNFKKTNKEVLIVVPNQKKELIRYSRNLPYAYMTTISSLDILTLLNYKNFVIFKDCLKDLEKRFSTINKS